MTVLKLNVDKLYNAIYGQLKKLYYLQHFS